jgi:hypothetical protein
MLREVTDFYDKLLNDPHDRYRSWEHCYRFFTENRKSVQDPGLHSLHLFAYLASWGMLRGSSFLLQKDYLFHNEIVMEILKPKYDSLVALNPKDMDRNILSLVAELSNRITEIYHKNTAILNGRLDDPKEASGTLVTKIMMGTLGCVPAYDRYFVGGLKYKNIPNRTFGPLAMTELFLFYRNNRAEIDETMEYVNSKSSIKYPIMKIIDMYFWQIGYLQDNPQ